MDTMSRRRFIGAASAAVAFPTIVSSRLRGEDAPSNKITVGFIGTGSHGTDRNLVQYLRQPDARVLVVCDVDSNRMKNAKAMVFAADGTTSLLG